MRDFAHSASFSGSSNCLYSQDYHTDFDAKYVKRSPSKDVPFGGFINSVRNLGVKLPINPNFGAKYACSSQTHDILKLSYYRNYYLLTFRMPCSSVTSMQWLLRLVVGVAASGCQQSV